MFDLRQGASEQISYASFSNIGSANRSSRHFDGNGVWVCDGGGFRPVNSHTMTTPPRQIADADTRCYLLLMKNANIFAGVIAAIWLSLLLMGMQIVRGAYVQHEAGFPSYGQITYYIGVPAIVFVGLSLTGILLNYRRRWRIALVLVSGAALLFLLPYLIAYKGGI